MAALALAPVAASAQIYRWVDDEGRTIVSDTPPPGKIKGQKVTKGDSAPSPLTTPPPAAGKAQGNGKAAEAPPKPVIQQTVQVDAALCKQAQQNLQVLESNVPLTTAGSDGQPTVMDETSRAREMAKLRGILQNCR